MPKKEPVPAGNLKGYYLITAKRNGKAIEIEGSSPDNGALVQLCTPTGAENQQWKLVPVSGEYFQLQCRVSGKVMDVINAGTENGAWIHQWDYAGPDIDNQIWYLVPAQDGYFKIKSKQSDKCLDIVGISEAEGARVQIWEDLDGDNQKWKLEPAGAKPAAEEPEQKAEESAAATVPGEPAKEAAKEPEKPTAAAEKEPAAASKAPAAKGTAKRTKSASTKRKKK